MGDAASTDYRQYAMGPLNATLVSITCILSMLGSLVIIISYIAWKDIRTVSRSILIWLSVCDFLIALGNMCGTFFVPESIDYKCIAQSFIVSSALISSFLWSIALAACLYVTIVKSKFALFQSFIPLLHLLIWSIGLVINIVAVSEKKLGNSSDQITAGWCWIKHNKSANSSKIEKDHELMWMILDYKGIEIIAYASIFFIFLMIKFRLRKEMEARATSPSTFDKRATVIKIAKRADRKLIIIPMLLILARLPGTIRFIIFATGKMPPSLKPWSKALLSLQGIGDSAQGLLNCIFFCFLQRKVRQHLKEAFCRALNWFLCKKTVTFNRLNTIDNGTSQQTNAKTPLLENNKLAPKYG